MKMSLYLHRPIVEVLSCYGELNEVINEILVEGAKGTFEVMDLPPCPGREGAGRYDVDVVEPNYLELVSIYTPFSPRISLRRLLYWFVENEVYNELGWKQTRTYINKTESIRDKKLANALSELEKAKRYCSSNVLLKIEVICNNIKTLQEYLNNV